MERERQTSNGFAFCISITALLLVSYVGAYYVMLEPTRLQTTPKVIVNYRVAGDGVATFFRPAHELDRLLRPHFFIAKLDGLRHEIKWFEAELMREKRARRHATSVWSETQK